jgi:hypothetical protein
MQIRQMPEMAESVVMNCVLPASPCPVKAAHAPQLLDAVQHGRQSDASFFSSASGAAEISALPTFSLRKLKPMNAISIPGPTISPETSMRRVIAGIFATLALCGGGALFLASPGEVSAAPRASGLGEGVYLVPANDGYGIADCISEKRACGKTVAETWCQTHGYRTALNFGVADRSDFTGSVSANGATGQKMPIVISCAK